MEDGLELELELELYVQASTPRWQWSSLGRPPNVGLPFGYLRKPQPI